MEYIADIGLEPETELDNSFRNGINESEWIGCEVVEYFQYMSQEDVDNIESMIYRLRHNKISKSEVESYLSDKFNIQGFTYLEYTTQFIIQFMYDMLFKNLKGESVKETLMYYSSNNDRIFKN